MSTDTRTPDAPMDAPAVGDHLALDVLNTLARPPGGGEVVDHWQSADDVQRWLVRHAAAPATRAAPAGLLAQARALRTDAHALIVARKAGSAGDVGNLDALNACLRAHVTAPQLQRDDDGRLAVVRVPEGDATAALLGPVAEAVADLLANGDFALVKQCEHPDCVLWFYDRTKSHRRRWCSMAVCGNRQKAARFRQQRK